jgi:hypothetical protein
MGSSRPSPGCGTEKTCASAWVFLPRPWPHGLIEDPCAFHLEAKQLYGGNPGLIFIGFGRASLPFYGGTLLVDFSPFVALPFVAQGAPGPGSGTLTQPLPIPDDPSLVGWSWMFSSRRRTPVPRRACRSATDWSSRSAIGTERARRGRR